MSWSTWIADQLRGLEDASLRREPRRVHPIGPMLAELSGQRIRLFSGNDYLGLAAHPHVIAAAQIAIAERGSGLRSSPLVCGYSDLQEALERQIAALKGKAQALVFSSGYAANVGTLTALAHADCAIFSDALNHASIVDGCRLARARGATVHVYRHADPEHLAEMLASSSSRRQLIVTDAVFSMEGTLAPLRDLVALKRRFGALLMVDDAHGTLVFGEGGGGVAQALGVGEGVDVQMGTLSKAVGALGGFVACEASLRALILNRARPFIYSTALPAPIVAAASTAIAVAREEPEHRQRLWRHVERLAQALGRAIPSAIVPLILGDAEAALAASRALLARGFYVPAIRYPSIPAGTARLRLTLSAAHSADDLKALIEALGECGLLVPNATGRASATQERD